MRATTAAPLSVETTLDADLAQAINDRDQQTLLATLVALPAHHPSRPELRGRVIEAWLPLANHLARRYSERTEPLEDLCQVAAMGLIKAIDRFDPTVGVDFVPFAVPTITGELKRHFRDHTWPVHVLRRVKDRIADVRQARDTLEQQLRRPPTAAEIAQRLNIGESEVREALSAANAYRSTPLEKTSTDSEEIHLGDALRMEESRYDLVEHRPALEAALAGLDPRARRVIFLRFFRDLSQQQIADHIGVSQMHVSRILAAATAALREAMGVTTDCA
jgi:RNA polymerase sigma-B factor